MECQSEIRNPKSKIQMKYGLALHTSSPALGLAIGSNNNDPRCQTWNLGRETSNYLHPYLLEFLRPQTWQDLEWIAIANGPGGFTGTRLGVVTARTLGQQLNVPVITISSLAAVAWQLDRSGSIAISMPAGRDEVFGAIYQIDRAVGQMNTIVTDTVFGVSDWEARLVEFAPTHHHSIAPSANLADTVGDVLALANMVYDRGDRPQWSMALPFYGQHPIINSPAKK
jgi:tRNA threonylcarbamoyl adenosine modification protein YeaZ